MSRLRIGIIDLVARGPTRALFARVMNANFASIMPQAVAVWCEAEGHDVTLVCYTGVENVAQELPTDIDLAFIGAFSEGALLAYALSSLFRSRGAVTVLGGPHARCYPEDARKYFDYVLGFTDQAVIRDVLQECARHRPLGVHLAAARQPRRLPGVRERWKFIEPTLRKARFLKAIPMISSLGCPYTCSFCIDSEVPFQPLDFAEIAADLRFVATRRKRPLVGWHDPNFGVKFDECMEAIEAAVPPGSMDFIAESSLSLLTEPRLRRLERNGFKALLPGVESWYDLGNKARTGSRQGLDKVREVSEQVNTVLRHVPYVQTNFVLGLDGDAGPEPFELTKRFLDLTPGAFPAYSLLSAFGRAAPINLQYQRDGRVLGFPFQFLDNNHAMNVRPKHYSWREFYDQVIGLSTHSFSWRTMARRFRANRTPASRWLNVVRGISAEGFARLSYHKEVRRRLDDDRPLRRYFEQDTDELPEFFTDQVRRNLGPLYPWLPPGALHHDPHAYLKSEQAKAERTATAGTLAM